MARTLAWAVAVVAAVVAAQTLPKAHAESTDARNALALALPNASTAAANAYVSRRHPTLVLRTGATQEQRGHVHV